jgi:hypothetical protein
MEPNPTVTSPPNLVDNGDGTITDTANGLMWEQKDTNGGLHDVGNFYPWAIVNGGVGQPTAAAAALCLSGSGASAGCVNVGGASPTAWSWLADLNAVDGTGFAGHSDWRLPSQSELQGIVNLAIPNCGPGSGIPCIDPIFGPSSVFGYWSSTNDPTDNTMAEVVPMNSGATLNVSDVKTFDGYFVRAVRVAP